jgi:hypothetical protein
MKHNVVGLWDGVEDEVLITMGPTVFRPCPALGVLSGRNDSGLRVRPHPALLGGHTAYHEPCERMFIHHSRVM